MSGLVDMWSSELAKLRNKDQSGSVQTSHEKEASHLADADERSSSGLSWQSSGLAKAVQAAQLYLPFQLSEASVSMLVESFSP